MKLERSDYIRSLEQLITISCILAGFSVSGLISLPGIEKGLYSKIVLYFQGNFDLAFYFCFFSLFFSTLCFLSTIMIILVYKINNYFVPLKKLRIVHFISNMVFSLAIATLVVAVISFAIPSTIGLISSVVIGVSIAGNFIWENMLPWQRKKREQQIKEEQQESAKP